MESFFEFFSFRDPSVVAVTVGVILLTASAAVVGTFTLLKKKALVGDAVAHAVLPGVCLAFLLSGTKNPWVLIVGAFATGWLSLLIMDAITRRSKIKEDTAIALVLSVFFGVGILLLTYIQHAGNAAQTGLDSFLFGKAAALVGQDLIVFSAVALLLLVLVGIFFKSLKIIAFDEAFATSLGLPVRKINLLLTSLTVMAVVSGIQAVGVVLMAAMLITPAAAARFWTDDVRTMTFLAAVLGSLSGLTGAYISYVAPNMPTGPWIVMVASIIALLSFFLAPRRGILIRYWQQRQFQQSIMDENILKALYHLEEARGHLTTRSTVSDITGQRYFPPRQLAASLRRLYRQGFIEKYGTDWQFTTAGRSKGKRVVKLHRLWEIYLSEYLKIAPDHVHEDAETMEHIITPELEAQLERLLSYPTVDPHNKNIPY